MLSLTAHLKVGEEVNQREHVETLSKQVQFDSQLHQLYFSELVFFYLYFFLILLKLENHY